MFPQYKGPVLRAEVLKRLKQASLGPDWPLKRGKTASKSQCNKKLTNSKRTSKYAVMFENPADFFSTYYFSQKGPVLNSGDPAVFQMVLLSSKLFLQNEKTSPLQRRPCTHLMFLLIHRGICKVIKGSLLNTQDCFISWHNSSSYTHILNLHT